jgi:hypothetical protein
MNPEPQKSIADYVDIFGRIHRLHRFLLGLANREPVDDGRARTSARPRASNMFGNRAGFEPFALYKQFGVLLVSRSTRDERLAKD